MKWKQLRITSNNIKHETDKAVLIKLYSKSKFNNYLMWHPKKLIEKHGWYFELTYHEDWEFYIFKDRQDSEKIRATAEDIEEAFQTTNDTEYDESYKIVDEPEKVEFDNIEVLDELKRSM